MVLRRIWVASLIAGFLGTSVSTIGALPVRAQDDWELTRPRSRGRPGTRSGRSPQTSSPRGRPLGRGRARPSVATPREAPRNEPDRTQVLIDRYLGIVEGDPRETFAFGRLLELYRERDGNIDALVAELTRRATADPDAYAPRMLLGHIYKAQNRVEEARAAYRRAAELRPRDAAPRVALAAVERAESNPTEARRLYDEALARTRDRVAREELLRQVAQLAIEMRDFDGARDYYRQLASGGQTSVYLRGEYARALVAVREWERAIEEYERVIRSLRGDNRVLPPVLLELSRALLESGRVDESIETLDRALRLAGSNAGIRAEIYEQMRVAYQRTDRLPELAERLRTEGGRGFEAAVLLGRIEDELGHDEQALASYRRALRLRSQDIETRRSIIQILLRSGRLNDAIEEYRALIRSAPREPQFVIQLAQLMMQTDRREDALRLVRDAARRHPRDPVLHQQLAELYTRWGEQALAAREVELLARIDPQDPAHVVALGAQQFDAGDRDAALRTWRRVLDVEPGAQGHATLAGILADHDLLPQAIEEYRAAVRLDPNEITHVRGLASTLERNRDNEEAETQWRRVLELAGDDRVARREARERIVGIWGRSRRLAQQIAELEERFRRDPPDAEAGRFLAEAHRRRGPQHQAQAEQVLERIVDVEPGDVESLLALERIRRHRGDLAGAIDALRRLRDADPRRAAHYLQQMAEHALALYRDEEAIRYAAEAVQRYPEDASAHRRLGDLYRARQDMERAISSYRRSLELNDRLYPVYFELAELHLARGETDQADRLYRQVLRVTPDDDLVSRAARASIQINLGAGTLAQLERELLPLALGHPDRPIFRRMAVELYDAYAGPLVERARRGGPGAETAAAELNAIGTRAIKPLLEALADQDPSQRRVALDILGDLGNPNAAAPLLALAESSTGDLSQRMQALRAAGAVAEPSLAGRFVSLAEGGDRRLHGMATWALARIGGRDAVRALRRFASSEDPTVRAYAAIGLGLHGGDGIARTLAARLSSEASEDVLLATTWALGRAGNEDQVPELVRVLESQGGLAAQIAADALGEIGGARAITSLSRALFDPDAALQRAAARALRRSGTRRQPGDLPPPHSFEAVRDYVHRLVDDDLDGGPPSPRVDGAGALAPEIDLSAWAPDLEAAASEALRGPVERVLAALAMLSAGSRGIGLGPLTGDLDAWPPAARELAHRTLDALADGLVDELVDAAGHVDAAVRVEAVRVLVRLGDSRANAAVAQALGDSPASVQRAALDALAASSRAPSRVVVERLAEIVQSHRDWSMRTRAARALARASDDVARSALREALSSDDYAFVREAAAAALGGGEGADVSALEHALRRDGEPRVRAAAARSLLAYGGEVAERARRAARSDDSARVRAVASGEPLR